MRKFNSPAAFAAYLQRAAVKMPPAVEAALAKEGRQLAKEAQALLGHYQREDTGPFPGWAELADSTQADRARHGYTPNDPLLRDGTLRDSIDSAVVRQPLHYRLYVGSDSKLAVYQEQGTRHIPPRPFLSLTLWRGRERAGKAAMTAAMHTLAGRLNHD